MKSLSLALCALAGCSTYYDVRFRPAPLEARISDDGEPVAMARALVSVRGVSKPRSDPAQPARVEMKLRIENLGEAGLELDGGSFELLSADLQPFGAAEIVPPPATPIAVAASQNFDLYFPVPAGKSVDDYDFSGLNLRFAVRCGERRIFTGASFQRLLPVAYYGYWDGYGGLFFDDGWCEPHWHVGVGVGTFSED